MPFSNLAMKNVKESNNFPTASYIFKPFNTLAKSVITSVPRLIAGVPTNLEHTVVRLITQESKKQDSLNSQTTGTRQPTNQRLQNQRESSKGACLQRGGKYLNTKVGRGTRVFSVCRRTTGASPFPLSLFSKHGSNPNEGLISLVRSLVESRVETSPTFSR